LDEMCQTYANNYSFNDKANLSATWRHKKWIKTHFPSHERCVNG
jgi:hypothetical protein